MEHFYQVLTSGAKNEALPEELKFIMEKFVASGCDLDLLYKRDLELI